MSNERWVTVDLFKAIVWHGCWKAAKFWSLWKSRFTYQSALFRGFYLCPYPNLIQLQDHPWRLFYLWFCSFSDLGLLSAVLHLCLCESLTVDRAPITDHFQHCHTPSVLAWEMLRLAASLLANMGPTHSDHHHLQVSNLTYSQFSLCFKVLIWHWLPDKTQREYFFLFY